MGGPCVLGIDPGFTGALCLLFKSGEVSVLDTPLSDGTKLGGIIEGRKAKTRIDGTKVTDWLQPHASQVEMAVIESVGAMPNQGLSSTFRFGEGYGVLQGVMAALRIKRVWHVLPAVWKATLGVTHDKRSSLDLAQRIVTEAGSTTLHTLFTRRKDDGRAEAFLLAFLGSRNLAWTFSAKNASRNKGVAIDGLF
jgi:hypothetical protein